MLAGHGPRINTNYAISVTGGTFNPQWFRVYIDYNNNGVFTDAGELVFSPANGLGTVSGNFTTPPAPTLSTLRQREPVQRRREPHQHGQRTSTAIQADNDAGGPNGFTTVQTVTGTGSYGPFGPSPPARQ
ncbi:MAG: hypothetical protein IPP33_02485 [Flavobacteriales bacterium]|nr:hypothetical protein [Flavobacteriales bacterium]